MHARVLILTTFDDDQFVYEALRAGPAGSCKTHVTRILAKLQLRDRVQAVVFAYENGLIQPGVH